MPAQRPLKHADLSPQALWRHASDATIALWRDPLGFTRCTRLGLHLSMRPMRFLHLLLPVLTASCLASGLTAAATRYARLFVACLPALPSGRRALACGLARGVLAWGCALLLAPPLQAGELYPDEIETFVGTDYIVGEPLNDLPVYPLFAAADAQSAKPPLLGYAFETMDFLEVRGFSGKPLNALVVLDVNGHFRVAQLISHKEPLFLRAGKAQLLQQFTRQIEGLSLQHEIDIGYSSDTPTRDDHHARLQGVLNGTVSIQAISRAIFESAATVAMAKLKVDVREQDIQKVRDPDAWRTSVNLDTGAVQTAAPVDAASGSALATNTAAANAVNADAETAGAAPAPTWRAPQVPSWWQGWQKRWLDLSILAVALLLLSLILARGTRLSASHRRLKWVRSAYAAFTLLFIGWHAQGQLTIVNLTAALEAWRGGSDLAFMLNDPITVVLWAYVGISLLVWGRGTFCGWLCPFGALQEWVSLIATRLGLVSHRLRHTLDKRLKWLKYGVLAAIIATTFWAPDTTEWALEVEPFKTAISFQFDREWPYVAWALAMLALSAFVYRGYCRYICPLGAALAGLSVLRRWDWIARRDACGRPCQSCRHRCAYQSIAPSGTVQYSECFQCLDCVAIYQDPKRCLPLIRMDKPKHRSTGALT